MHVVYNRKLFFQSQKVSFYTLADLSFYLQASEPGEGPRAYSEPFYATGDNQLEWLLA